MLLQVLNDADIESAARDIIYGAYINSGQMCVSTERVIVQRGVAKELTERLKTLASKITAGPQAHDGKGPALGPVFSKALAADIIHMIEEAVAEGAEVLVGDMKVDGASVQPHIVVGAKPGSRLWERESFGPGERRGCQTRLTS